MAQPMTLELVEAPDGVAGLEEGSTRASFLKLGGVALTGTFLAGLAADDAEAQGGPSRAGDLRGGRPARAPRFNFRGTTSSRDRFLRTSVVLESTDIAALNGAGPLVTKSTLAAAGALVSVEARHAAWGLDILGRTPAPRAFDPGLSLGQVIARVRRTRFVPGL